jgi:hypothetical protein
LSRQSEFQGSYITDKRITKNKRLSLITDKADVRGLVLLRSMKTDHGLTRIPTDSHGSSQNPASPAFD